MYNYPACIKRRKLYATKLELKLQQLMQNSYISLVNGYMYCMEVTNSFLYVTFCSLPETCIKLNATTTSKKIPSAILQKGYLSTNNFYLYLLKSTQA